MGWGGMGAGGPSACFNLALPPSAPVSRNSLRGMTGSRNGNGNQQGYGYVEARNSYAGRNGGMSVRNGNLSARDRTGSYVKKTSHSVVPKPENVYIEHGSLETGDFGFGNDYEA